MTRHEASITLGITLALVGLTGLLGCEDAPPPTGNPPPYLGPCHALSATLTDAGPVAHVYEYEGRPCGDGGTCQSGVCR